jgi:predicted DNA-binding WGR domain protein
MRTLVKIDPIKHMRRWYTVGVQSTLLDGVAVIYGWGSLKSSFQQWRRISVSTIEEAEKICDQMIRVRMKKGYKASQKVI